MIATCNRALDSCIQDVVIKQQDDKKTQKVDKRQDDKTSFLKCDIEHKHGLFVICLLATNVVSEACHAAIVQDVTCISGDAPGLLE